jgi:hypothetical protein
MLLGSYFAMNARNQVRTLAGADPVFIAPSITPSNGLGTMRTAISCERFPPCGMSATPTSAGSR